MIDYTITTTILEEEEVSISTVTIGVIDLKTAIKSLPDVLKEEIEEYPEADSITVQIKRS